MSRKLTTHEFVARAINTHGNRYDYSESVYVSDKIKVNINCRVHGEFSQDPRSHYALGNGCPLCGKIASVRKKVRFHIERKDDFSHITPPAGSKIIALSQGAYTIVDDDDYDKYSGYNWFLSGRGYACCRRLGNLHRVVMGVTDPKIHVDHRLHDRLDNRKCNLRICTKQENNQNRRPLKGAASKYKGVIASSNKKRWSANIKHNFTNYYLGLYDTQEEAAIAYDAKARELHGEFACLNFTDTINNI